MLFSCTQRNVVETLFGPYHSHDITCCYWTWLPFINCLSSCPSLFPVFQSLQLSSQGQSSAAVLWSRACLASLIHIITLSIHPSLPLSWKACPVVGVTIMWSPMSHHMIHWVTMLTASHIWSVRMTYLYPFPCRIQLSCPTTMLSVPRTPLTATASSHMEPSQGGATPPPHLTILR